MARTISYVLAAFYWFQLKTKFLSLSHHVISSVHLLYVTTRGQRSLVFFKEIAGEASLILLIVLVRRFVGIIDETTILSTTDFASVIQLLSRNTEIIYQPQGQLATVIRFEKRREGGG